jgi:hypothetical protein
MTDQLAENSVRTYHLPPEGLGRVLRKLLGQRVVLSIGVIAIVFSVQYKEFGGSWKGSSISSILAPILVMVVVFGSLATGTVNGLKRSREAWFSYELTIGNDFLTTKIKDFPELEIQQHEITAIKENADGLRVETGTKGRTIWIGTDLVEYQDARARLSRWMPVQESGGWRTSGRWAYISSVLSTSLLVCFYVVSKSWAIIAIGVPLLVGLSWCLWYMQKRLHVSAYVKRLSLLSILPLLAILAKMILAITNWH